MAMAKRQPGLTEAEWTVISVVWELEPCTAPTVTDALAKDKGWSYSTVKTLLDRMLAKGLLSPERRRNSILYRSLITRNAAQRRSASRVGGGSVRRWV